MWSAGHGIAALVVEIISSQLTIRRGYFAPRCPSLRGGDVGCKVPSKPPRYAVMTVKTNTCTLPLTATSNMKTKALVVEKPGAPWQLREINLDDNLQDDEVLVQMKATGVCHTDLNFSKEETMPGLHPVVLGHEGISQPVLTCADH